MVGRMAYNTPWDLVRVDRELYGETEDSKNREQLLTVSLNINSLWFIGICGILSVGAG
jgi:hypothetical protein